MKQLLALVCISLLAGCATVNAAAKAKTDQLVAQTGSHHEPAPASYDPPQWAPGSWMAMKTVHNGKPSYTKVSVLSQDAEGIWVETENWTYDGHDISKILYSRMPKTAGEAGELIKRMVTKHNDEPVQTTDMDANPMMRTVMKSMLSSGIFAPTDVSSAPKETVTVAGGTFEGAAKYEGRWQFGPMGQTVIGHYHPAVPVNGAVQGKSTDGSTTVEVIDYGWSGATSALP